MKIKSWLKIGMILLLLITWNGCKNEEKAKVKLYTSLPKSAWSEVETGFEAKHPNIDLEVTRKGGADLESLLTIEAEMPNGIQADVIWAADPSFFLSWKKQGVLMSYTSSEAGQISDLFRDDEDYYIAGRIINIVIVYNTQKVSEFDLPTTWKDLINPKWNGKVAIANPLKSGSALIGISALVQNYGWEFFEQLKQNNAKVILGTNELSTNPATARSVLEDDFLFGITLDYVARQQLSQEAAEIGIIYPEDGVISIPSPLAIVKNTQNAKASKTFMDYVLSVSGQELLVKKAFFYPTRNDVDPPYGNPPVSDLISKSAKMKIDWQKAKNEEITVKRVFYDKFLR